MYYRRLPNAKPFPVTFTDQSSWVVPHGWCGTLRQSGTIRFYCKTDTDDLGKTGEANKKSGWTVDKSFGQGFCQGEPGDLPATNNRKLAEKFWGKAKALESATRNFYVAWRCCGNPDEDYAHAFANPS